MNGDNINRVVNKYMPWEEESLDEWKKVLSEIWK